MKDLRIRNTDKMCFKKCRLRGSEWHLTVVTVAAVLYSQPPSTYTLTLSGKREWCALLPDSFQACENCSLLRWNLRGEIQIAEASRAHQARVNKRDIQYNQ
jgi:hypothetical protein